MDTERARELLPWLLNGSLEEPERSELLTALRTSEELRRELAETCLAGEIFGQHVAAADLVAYAFGELAGLDRGRIEAHLASCERCAEELALARESRELAGDAEAGAAATEPTSTAEGRRRGWLLPFLRPAAVSAGGVAAGWQVAALAASLAAVIGLGGWIWTWQQAEGRVADLIASVRDAAPPASGEEVDTLGLVAETEVLRGAGDRALTPSAAVGVYVLYVYNDGVTPDGTYELRLIDPGAPETERELLRTVPSERAEGQLTFRVPVERLKPGATYSGELYRLEDRRGWVPVERYSVPVGSPR